MSLVVVINCGAGNALRGFEISIFLFFLKLYFIHIFKLHLRAQNAIKQCKWYISRKPLYQGLRKCKIDKSVIMQGRTAASYIVLKIAIWGYGKGEVFLQKRILYSWTQNSSLWITQLSSNFLHSNQFDIWKDFWDIIKSVRKSCPS